MPAFCHTHFSSSRRLWANRPLRDRNEQDSEQTSTVKLYCGISVPNADLQTKPALTNELVTVGRDGVTGEREEHYLATGHAGLSDHNKFYFCEQGSEKLLSSLL